MRRISLLFPAYFRVYGIALVDHWRVIAEMIRLPFMRGLVPIVLRARVGPLQEKRGGSGSTSTVSPVEVRRVDCYSVSQSSSRCLPASITSRGAM